MVNNKSIGTTFARQYSSYLGLDPKKALDDIIKLGLNPIRIGVYWDEIQQEPEFRFQSKKPDFNFEHFDWIIEKLSKNNIDIILAVGAKTPRWPEFHLPEFIKNKYQFGKNAVIDNPFFLADVKNYIKTVLDRYKKIKQIKWIQVENEPFEPFGPDRWTIDSEFLAEEIKFVKSLTKKPILITNSGLDPTLPWIGQLYGKYRRLKNCLNQKTDIVGLDVYPIIPKKFWGKFRYFKAGNSQWKKLDQIKKQIQAHNMKPWITELQAEPWEPRKMKTKNAFANPSCNPDLVCQYLKKAQEIGFDTILLWGAEFWLACEKDKNTAWINNLKGFFIDR